MALGENSPDQVDVAAAEVAASEVTAAPACDGAPEWQQE